MRVALLFLFSLFVHAPIAANLTKPMDRIIAQFKAESKIDIRVSYGSIAISMPAVAIHLMPREPG